jgi:hypothetical protein
VPVPAHLLEAEHLLIEFARTFQVGHLNADMVDGRGPEVETFLRVRRRPTGCHHRKTSNEFAAAQRPLLETRHQIRNDRLHVVLLGCQSSGSSFTIKAPSHEVVPAHLLPSRWLIRAYRDLASNETDAIGGDTAMGG